MKRSFRARTLRANFALILSLLALFQCTEEDFIEPEITAETEEVTAHAVASSLVCSSCTFIIPAGKTTIDAQALGIKPGAVVCFKSGVSYGYVTLTNFTGTADNPIIISNCGGEVTINAPSKPFVLKIANSKYFRVTGGNVNNGYGIKLTGASTNGLVLGPFTTNFEIDHMEVYQVGFAGMMAKTDPTCDNATVRGSFTMKNVSFHHNYIHDTGGEGFYIGHTAFGGANTACGIRLPHTIEGVRIYRNLVRNSGWDGIQLSSATKGAVVNNNIVENYSTLNNPDQRGGICIGGGTGGVCHSNLVKGGNGPGMVIFGLADNLIHNNIITDAGTMGIFCDERTAPGSGYRFIHNTIINPKTEGIRLYSDQVPMNVFVNNIIVNPGTFSLYGNNAYVMKLSSNVKVQVENNFFTLNINDAKFLNAAAGNFRLTSTSPLIDAGKEISVYNISRDFYNAVRLKGFGYDIGASEF